MQEWSLLPPGIERWLARLAGDFFLRMPIAPGPLIESKVSAGQCSQGIEHGLILDMKNLQFRPITFFHERPAATEAGGRCLGARPIVDDAAVRGGQRFNKWGNGRAVAD